MPLCGVLDPPYEFQWLGDYTLNAQQLAGYGAASYPASGFQALLPDITAGLFSSTTQTTWTPNAVQGARLRDVAINLTGGPRPVIAAAGFESATWQQAVLGTGGSDGTINGILAKNIYGNPGVTYRWTQGATPTAAETAYNQSLLRVTADPAANPLQPGGLRWLPVVEGKFKVPVLTMHTLGDFYVPFGHETHYFRAAQQNGNTGSAGAAGHPGGGTLRVRGAGSGHGLQRLDGLGQRRPQTGGRRCGHAQRPGRRQVRLQVHAGGPARHRRLHALSRRTASNHPPSALAPARAGAFLQPGPAKRGAIVRA